MQQQIEILSRHKIDAKKWDACISSSSNAVIYAYSFYLDALCENWSGIIINNYEAVMPVPWRKKIGIAYTYSVPFVQQLGYFSGDKNIDEEALLKFFFQHFKYGDYTFNFENKIDIVNTKRCNNFIIHLSQEYEKIAAAYSQDLINNLKKTSKENLFYSAEENFETGIEVFKNMYAERTPHVTDKDFSNFQLLCKTLSAKNQIEVRKVTNAANELLAIALLLKDERRLYNMMNSTTDAGRKTSANHFLFDQLIKEFSNTNLILDFEGSDLPGIKSFYEKFGAVNQPYASIHFNHLPFPMKLFKR